MELYSITAFLQEHSILPEGLDLQFLPIHRLSASPDSKMTKYQIATRAQVLGLLAAGLSGPVVQEHTGIGTATQYRWWDKAIARGFDPKKRPLLILDEYVDDGKRTGRPRKIRQEEGECNAVNSTANNTALEGEPREVREGGQDRCENENENGNGNDTPAAHCGS
ncbi:hypothetical protein VM1G_04114 [Cytospora mali]|uniref:Uncharacterized protein n=1 Tax=Cytospora mali TaxID=578113 RepID=A0A194VY13_CYTMA|nr:hypothetical protein VM1G_04114 [Valsa mali]